VKESERVRERDGGREENKKTTKERKLQLSFFEQKSY
jgi:hypothetical protein